MYFIANWKMYGDLKSINSIKNVIKLSKKPKYKKAKIIYCPPYTLLDLFVKKTNKTKIDIGAQNSHTHQNYGAFTGSINAKMIKNTGSKFVIIGHSENRNSGDTDLLINKKIKSSLKNNLNVLIKNSWISPTKIRLIKIKFIQRFEPDAVIPKKSTANNKINTIK